MREYRGKRIDNGQWVYGWYHQLDHADHHGKAFIIPSHASSLYSFEVDPETIGQHTGVKNIYRDDILPPDEQWGEVTIICYDVHQACYKRVPLGLYKANAGGGGWSRMPLRWHSAEQIGNIHDNPELLISTR